jgi:hypothetical protein
VTKDTIPVRSALLFERGSLAVWLKERRDGAFVFEGQDLHGPFGDEYEYWITVPEAQLPAIRRALDGSEDADLFALVCDHGETIVTAGERRWLQALGIEPEFASWS